MCMMSLCSSVGGDGYLAVEGVEERVEACRDVPLALEHLHVEGRNQGAVGGHGVRPVILHAHKEEAKTRHTPRPVKGRGLRQADTGPLLTLILLLVIVATTIIIVIILGLH